MTDRSSTKLALWPFVLCDIIFLGVAYLIFSIGHRPLTFWEAVILAACVGAGAWSLLTPFLRQNAAAIKLAESESLTTTVAQIQNLEQVAAQISSATNHLKTAQDQSAQTATAASKIADKMAEESRAFSEFIQKANDTEKSHLRLEVEKLRRAEGDWLQILVHVLDHIFALRQAAVRSGKSAVIEQIGNFQNVCRDTARRIGLVCHSPEAQQPFDDKLHQIMDGEPQPENGTPISEALVTGYSYQGRVIRRAMVRIPAAQTAPEEIAVTEAEVAAPEPTRVEEPLAEEAPAEAGQKSLF